jgi:hypothetical protein
VVGDRLSISSAIPKPAAHSPRDLLSQKKVGDPKRSAADSGSIRKIRRLSAIHRAGSEELMRTIEYSPPPPLTSGCLLRHSGYTCIIEFKTL